jgi:hypothetical protein
MEISVYRIIETSIWNSPKIRPHGPFVKLLAVYLFGNDQSHVSGLYFLSKAKTCEDLGLTQKQFNEAFSTLCKERFCFWDDALGLVWVKNLLKKNGKGPKVATSVGNHLKTLHKSKLIVPFLKYYQDYNIPYSTVDDTVSDTVSDTTLLLYPVPEVLSSCSSRIKKEKGEAPPKTVEAVQEKLSAINITEIEKEFGDRIDVIACFDDFCDYCLGKGAKDYGIINPADWTYFNKAFRDSCRRSIDKGWHKPKKASNQSGNWRKGIKK